MTNPLGMTAKTLTRSTAVWLLAGSAAFAGPAAAVDGHKPANRNGAKVDSMKDRQTHAAEPQTRGDREVTLASMVRAMADRDQLARYPEDLPYKALQASSYDRATKAPIGSPGWFANADGVGHIRKENNGDGVETVLMEHTGPGAIVKMWAPFFFRRFKERVGPRVRIYLDGNPTPVIDEHFIELLTRNEFRPPWSPPAKQNGLEVPSPFSDFSARAGNLYLPIPYQTSCKVTVLNDGNFYNIINYVEFPPGTEVRTYAQADFGAAKDTLAAVGKELNRPTPFTGGVSSKLSGAIAPGAARKLDLPAGEQCIRHVEIRLGPDANPQRLRSTILKMTFDGNETVWAPVGDFFCSGPFIKPYRTWERDVRADGTMVCRWVMPYRASACIEIENVGPEPVEADLTVRTGAWKWDGNSMHFHARWRYEDPTSATDFRDWNFIDISGQGVYVADQWTVLTADDLWWGEGDEKVYVDDAYEKDRFPTHIGTGTEDYYGWAGGEPPRRYDEFSVPFLANVSVGDVRSPRGYNICTRSRALDAIPFHTRFRIDLEALPLFAMQRRQKWELMHYSATTYYYALPGATDNRRPQSEKAALAAISLTQLESMQDALRDGLYLVPNASEFESLPVSDSTNGMAIEPEAISTRDSTDRWSNGRQVRLGATKAGDFVEYTFEQRYEPTELHLRLGKSSDYGILRFKVNGQVKGNAFDGYSPELVIAPLIDLGTVTPNAANEIVLRIEVQGKSPASDGFYAGLDCLILGNPNADILYRLGEDDADAAAGSRGADATKALDGKGAGLARHGAPLYSDTTREAGAGALSMQFDGKDDYYEGALPIALTENVGIECWVRLDAKPAFAFPLNSGVGAANGFGIVAQDFGQGYNWHLLFNGVAVVVRNGAPAQTGVWTHLAAVADDGTWRLYVNGVEAGTHRGRSPAPNADKRFSIGAALHSRRGFEGPFPGLIDDVRVFTFLPGAFDPADLDHPAGQR